MITRVTEKPLFLSSIPALLLTVSLFLGGNLHGSPRAPFPPIPERNVPLYHETFDEEYSVTTTNCELVIPALGNLEQGFSGYAVQRAGEEVIPYIVPALDATGYTNVTCDTAGAIRFWINPYWSSQSVSSGTGPGAVATLLELDAVSGSERAMAWSLQASADGNTLELLGQSGSGLQEILASEIAWTAGAPHCVVLDFVPGGTTTLYIDSVAVAQGTGLVSIPPSTGQLVLGSTLAGTNTAVADFDELFSFNQPLTASAVCLYYQMTSAQAALGPVSDGEHWHPRRHLESEADLSRVYDSNPDGSCTNVGNVFMTNFSATLTSNGTTTINFDVRAGTNGLFYNIYSLTNLADTLNNSQWSWVGQALTCNNYAFTNQPSNDAFYFIMPPFETEVWAFDLDDIDNYGQTNVPPGLANVTAIAAGGYFSLALCNTGTVIGWGDNSYGETNIPFELTNVIAIAAGEFHGVALLANGSVTNWGYYEDGAGVFCSVTNRGEATAPPASNVVAVATGGNAALALQSDGTVIAWGDPTLTNVPVAMIGVKSISAGFEHNLALTSSSLAPLTTQPAAGFAPLGGSFTFSLNGLFFTNVQYQWQFNGVNLVGATNATLTLTNLSTTNNGSYQAVIYNSIGVGTSVAATFAIATPPQITDETPPALGPIWINSPTTLSVAATAVGLSDYPLTYEWLLDGNQISDATNSNYAITNLTPTNDGDYTVVVTNALGATNIAWDIRLALPGMVETWGDDFFSDCDRPATLTNVAGIAAGEFQSVAVTDTGFIVEWGCFSDGYDYFSVSNFANVRMPPDSGVVAVAAGLTQALALMDDGTVQAWGLYGAYGTEVPDDLTGVKAIACGWEFDVALLTNGTVTAWGEDYYHETNVPPGLTNVTAISANAHHALALLANGSVQAWGDGVNGDTNVPVLTNAVAIAAGKTFNLALKADGCVVAWGTNDFGYIPVPPTNMSNVMAIAAGDNHCLALINDGTLVSWGDNSEGQTNLPFGSTNVLTKLIAAGGNHSMATIFSPLVQYPVDVSKDLLLIYNSNSLDSSNVYHYYLTHRPMVSNANVLGIGCTTNTVISPSDFTNYFMQPVQNWLATNCTKRPLYVILFQDIPQQVNSYTNSESSGDGHPSVQYQLHYTTAPGWLPFVTAINMNGLSGTNYFSSDGTNDCIAYIDKLVNMATNNPPGTFFISASAGGYNNTNWYFDYAGGPPTYVVGLGLATNAEYGVTNVDPTASVIVTSGKYAGGLAIFTTNATNVAGYLTGGWDGGTGDSNMFVDGTVKFFGDSGWYIMATVDSYNGQRVTGQAGYLTWFSNSAFWGSNNNYSNTPVGAVTTVNEPSPEGKPNSAAYYGDWAAGKSFAISAWDAQVQGSGIPGIYFQAVGDPFVRK